MATPDTTTAIAVQAAQKVYSFPDEAAAAAFEHSANSAGGDVLRLVPIAPAIARPLYDIECHLAALVDTEDSVPDDLEKEYAAELTATLLSAVDKRDRVGQFMAWLESQIGLGKAEVKRLQERTDFFERALARMDSYVTRIILDLGKDAKGKRKKLEGNTVTFSLHGCDQRLSVTDEQAVPTKYKRVTVTLPAETWELMLDSLDLELREQVLEVVKRPQVEVVSTLAKGDLKAGVDVPGAELAGGYYLERK